MMSVSLAHRRRRQTAALLGSVDICRGRSGGEKRVMSGERTAIEREMFIATDPETVFGFLIDPVLTWRWIAGRMAFLRSSHKKGGEES